ncbi:MAG: hypothetical protein AB7K63_10405 [Vicinamibacterales bacterium]
MPSIRIARAADGRLIASGLSCWSAGYQAGDGAGIFAGWRFEGGRFALFNDRYGLHPLFCWQSDDACVIADSVQALLEAGAPRALNEDALAVFVRIGFFLGDDTPFRAIRAVPPSAVLDPATLGISGRLPRPRPAALGRDDAIDAFLAVFDRAIARRPVRGRFEMPLSGGRDSRHILLALHRAGAHPAACVTVDPFPPRTQADRRVAAAVCERLAIPHRALRQPLPRLEAERDKNRRTSLCAAEHAQFVALADDLAGRTCESYDGIAGDVLTQSAYLTTDLHAAFASGDWLAAADGVLNAGGRAVSEPALARLLQPAWLARLSRDRARARVARAAREVSGWPNPVAAFYFWNRTRREIALAPFALMRPVTMLAPFLDPEVFDLLAGLPAALQLDRRFHTDAIARAYPEVRDVPYAVETGSTGAPGARRLAAALGSTMWRRRDWFNLRGMAPSLLATAADGRAERLWHLPLTVWLAEMLECRG